MPPKFTPLSMGRKVFARTLAMKAKLAVKENANPASLRNVQNYSIHNAASKRNIIFPSFIANGRSIRSTFSRSTFRKARKLKKKLHSIEIPNIVPLRAPLRYMKNAKIRYDTWSTQSPYNCGIATGVTMLTLSDLFAQRYTSNEPYNWKRTLGMALFGASYYGVFMKRLYFQYEIWFGAKATFKSSAMKTGFDLFVNSPFILLPYYYLLTQSIQGLSLQEITKKFRTEFWGSYIGTLGFWIPGCLGNFYFVPVQFRILFLCWLSFCHKFWLSWFSNKNPVPTTEEAALLNDVHLQV